MHAPVEKVLLIDIAYIYIIAPGTPRKRWRLALLSRARHIRGGKGKQMMPGLLRLDLAMPAQILLFSIAVLAFGLASAAEPQVHEDEKAVTLENDRLRIVFDKGAKGNLAAIVDKQSAQNLAVPPADSHRLYTLFCANDEGKIQELSNNDAAEIRYEIQRSQGVVRLVETFAGHAGQKITAAVTVALRADSPLSAWRIEVKNEAGVLLKNVAFPVIHAPLTIGPGGEGDAIALPVCDGYLIEQPSKSMSKGASRRGPYPGGMSAQLMAFYGKPAGLYMATYDAAGHPKEIAVTRRENDLAFYYVHHFPEEKGGGWAMPYDFVLGTFHGDWHDAADIYKEWAVRQFWCARTLAERDVPAWVKEAPVFHTLSVRAIDKQKKPYNSLPILPAHVRRFCEALKTKECAMIMGWEKNGGWVTPHYFPPFGGAELFRKATSEILKDGNHTLVFLSGLKWTLKNNFNIKGFNDYPTFEKEGARWAVAGQDGKPLILGKPDRDTGEYAQLCQATQYTKDLLTGIALECVDLGITCVQMDQVVGMGSPPCYSKEHGHPVGYGAWQYEHLCDLFARMREECRKKNHDFALSMEEPAELAIPLLEVYHARDYAQGRWPRGPGLRRVPLFTYLYHEYVLGYGGDSAGVSANPSDAYVLQQALNLVCGKTPGIAVWGSLVEPSEIHPDQLRMLKAHTNLLHTAAREYLLMGRMIHPLRFDAPTVAVKVWEKATNKTFAMEFPGVLHSGWALPNGNRGYVFANISHSEATVNTEVPETGEGGRPVTITAYSTDKGPLAPLAANEPLPKKISFTLKPQEAFFVEIILAHKDGK